MSISKAKPVDTVRVRRISDGVEVSINREDYEQKLHRVIDGTDVSLLGSRKPMATEQLLVKTIDRLASAIGGGDDAPSVPVDDGKLDAALAQVAELKALLAAKEVAPEPKAPAKKKAPAKRAPRKV